MYESLRAATTLIMTFSFSLWGGGRPYAQRQTNTHRTQRHTQNHHLFNGCVSLTAVGLRLIKLVMENLQILTENPSREKEIDTA